MKRLDIAKRSYRNLKQSKIRTILTALAIAVGATTICLALAAGNGGRDYIDRSLAEHGIDVRDINVYAAGTDEATGTPQTFCAHELSLLEHLPDVDSVVGAGADYDAKDCFYSVKIRAVTEQDVDPVMAAVHETFPDRTLMISSEKDSRADLFQNVNIAQYGLIGFGALAILASIFGIINTQYISVLERTREIGLMKALGMKKKDIARLFRYEAAWIGLLGGLIGVAIAYLISLANPFISSFLGLEEDIRLLQVDPLQSIILILSLMIISIVSGLIPAKKAAKLDPIEALRTE